MPPSPGKADLVVPREQDTTGVLGGVGKATVEIFHEHIHLLIGEALHCLLHICCFEPRQNIQHYTKIPLLHMHTCCSTRHIVSVEEVACTLRALSLVPTGGSSRHTFSASVLLLVETGQGTNTRVLQDVDKLTNKHTHTHTQWKDISE